MQHGRQFAADNIVMTSQGTGRRETAKWENVRRPKEKIEVTETTNRMFRTIHQSVLDLFWTTHHEERDEEEVLHELPGLEI